MGTITNTIKFESKRKQKNSDLQCCECGKILIRNFFCGNVTPANNFMVISAVPYHKGIDHPIEESVSNFPYCEECMMSKFGIKLQFPEI